MGFDIVINIEIILIISHDYYSRDMNINIQREEFLMAMTKAEGYHLNYLHEYIKEFLWLVCKSMRTS